MSEDLSVRSHPVGGSPALQAARQAQAERPVIQAVDYAPMPESPIPDPGLPGDPVGRGAGPTGAEIWSVIDKLPQGNSSFVREVRTPQDLGNLWDWMRQNGAEIANPYGESRKGISYNLPDNSRISQRFQANSTGKPALDIDVPGQEHIEVHINPRGGVPEIASAPKLQAEASSPLSPAESPSARGGGLPGRVLSGGVIPDNVLPHLIEPPQTKQIPVIGDGKPDPET